MTKLGSMSTGIPAAALPKSEAPSGSKLSQIDFARGEEVDLPVLGHVWLQVVAHHQTNVIEGATLKAMRDAGIPVEQMFAYSVDMNRKARTLAMAVFEITKDGKHVPFGTTEEWLNMVDDNVIYACHLKYDEMKDRLDPLAGGVTEERAAEILMAMQKKSRALLLSFGISELVSFLLSSDVQQSMFPTRSSGSSESSPDISTT